MFKVAFLGTENSHSQAFARFIKEGRFPGLETVGAYGYDDEANKKIIECGVPYIAASADEFVGKVDAVMVTARHGDLHYDYAMPYIKAGIPAFIDKPFCINKERALEMARTAAAGNVLLTGGSCLAFDDQILELKNIVQHPEKGPKTIIGGAFSAPVGMDNPYGGFFFYSQHLVEMVTSVFGYDVKSVLAIPEHGKRITAIFRYEPYDVTLRFYEGYGYTAAVYGTNQTLLRLCGKDVSTVLFARELQSFADMLKTGTMPRNYIDLLRPLWLLHAINDSMASGEFCDVVYPEL